MRRYRLARQEPGGEASYPRIRCPEIKKEVWSSFHKYNMSQAKLFTALYKSMLGTLSSSSICPICGNEMSAYSDWNPFNAVQDERMYCGFCHHTGSEQFDLEIASRLWDEYGEEFESKKSLEPLTKKDCK